MVSLFSGDNDDKGVMKGFNSLLVELTSSTQGMYAIQKNNYTDTVDRFDYQIDLMELRLSKREESLRARFNTMEQLISTLNAQGDFLTQQLNLLNRDE